MKRLFSLIIIITLSLFLFLSCEETSNDNIVTEDAYGNEISGDEEELEETSSDDEIAVLLTNAPSNESVHFCLLRDGNYYSLDSTYTSLEEGYDASIYTSECAIGGRVGFHSHGDVPVPVLQDGDVVVSAVPRDVPTLRLYKVDFYGYGVDVTLKGKSSELWIGNQYVMGARDVQLDDGNGNTFGDMYNLEQGEWYRLSWYEGSIAELKGTEVDANSKAYVYSSFNPDDIYNWFNTELLDSHDYEIEASNVNNGMAEYDLTSISPGVYRIGSNDGLVSNGGLIEIK